MKTRFLWIAGAITALGFASVVQADDDAIDLSKIGVRVAPLPNGYSYASQRNSDRIIWSTGNPPPGDWRSGTGLHAGYDDLTFTPGCGSGGGPYGINGVGFAYIINQGTGKQDFDIRLQFYSKHIGDDGSGGSVYDPDSLFGEVTFEFTGQDVGFIYYYPDPIAIPQMDTDSQTIGFRLDCFNPGTTDYHPNVTPCFRGLIETLPSGSSNPNRWADADGDGVIKGNEGKLGGAGNTRRMYGVIQANVSDPSEPSATDLGTLADGVTTKTGSNSAKVDWYKVTLASDATDAAAHFLDIDTEGSSADVAIALYDSTGALSQNISYDEDSGSGSNDQLTYGIGIRQAVGDGRQYDGRGGQLAAGTYFLAVAPSGSTFGDCYNVSPGAGGGDYTLNLNTNTNGSALDASVEPALTEDIGELTNPGYLGIGYTVDRYSVNWHKFSICGSAVDPNTYLDADWTGSSSVADMRLFLFDADGKLLLTRRGNGPNGGVFPQLSFGNVGPRPPYSGVEGDPEFTGAECALTDGTYYLAVTLTDGVEASSTGSRWHVRSNAGSSLTEIASFYTDIDNPDDCGGSLSDTDGDGIVDVCDGCPNDANKGEPGECGCGNPDTDSDGDGIADCNDNCPDVPNADQADSDNDGIGDACDAPATVRGDSNLDGSVNFNDIDCFVASLISYDDWLECGLVGEGSEASYVGANDIDQNNAVTFEDIDGFVECLINEGCD